MKSFPLDRGCRKDCLEDGSGIEESISSIKKILHAGAQDDYSKDQLTKHQSGDEENSILYWLNILREQLITIDGEELDNTVIDGVEKVTCKAVLDCSKLVHRSLAVNLNDKFVTIDIVAVLFSKLLKALDYQKIETQKLKEYMRSDDIWEYCFDLALNYAKYPQKLYHVVIINYFSKFLQLFALLEDITEPYKSPEFALEAIRTNEIMKTAASYCHQFLEPSSSTKITIKYVHSFLRFLGPCFVLAAVKSASQTLFENLDVFVTDDQCYSTWCTVMVNLLELRFKELCKDNNKQLDQKDLEQWLNIWSIPLIRQLKCEKLGKNQEKTYCTLFAPLISISESILPQFFRMLDKELKVVSIEHRTLVYLNLLQTAKSSGAISGSLTDNLSIIGWDHNTIESLLNCHNEEIKRDAYKLLVASHFTTNEIPRFNLELIQNNLIELLSIESAKYRTDLKGIWLNFTRRISARTKLLHREQKSSQKKSGKIDLAIESELMNYRSFIQNIIRIISETLTLTANYSQKISCLTILVLILQMEQPDDLFLGNCDQNRIIENLILKLKNFCFDSYEDIRLLSSVALENIPDDFFTIGEDFNESAAKGYLTLMKSTRTAQSDGAVKLFLALSSKKQKNLSSNVHAAYGKSDSHFFLFQVLDLLMENIESELRSTKEVEIPISQSLYGSLKATRLVLIEMMKTKTENAKQELNLDKAIVLRVTDICDIVWRKSQKLLCDDVPDLPFSLEDDADCPKIDHSRNSVLFAFRGLMEAGKLLITSIELNINDTNIESCFRRFIDWLLSVRHRGVSDALKLEFTSFCIRLAHQRLYPLEKQKIWLEMVFREIENSNKGITRRSAGIPGVLSSLTCIDERIKGIKRTDESLLSDVINHLSSLIDKYLSSELPSSYDVSVHCLNCLRALFNEPFLRESSAKYLPQVFKIVIRCISSNIWPVKNAGAMLISALVSSIFGGRPLDEFRESGRTFLLSTQQFFKLHPFLKPILIDELKRYQQTVKRETDVAFSVAPIFNILAKLSFGKVSDSKDQQICTEIKQYLEEFLRSTEWKIREMASATFPAVISPESYREEIEATICIMVSSDSNYLHGCLLKLEALLENAARNKFLDEKNTHLISSQLMDKMYDIIVSRHCMVTDAKFFEICFEHFREQMGYCLYIVTTHILQSLMKRKGDIIDDIGELLLARIVTKIVCYFTEKRLNDIETYYEPIKFNDIICSSVEAVANAALSFFNNLNDLSVLKDTINMTDVNARIKALGNRPLASEYMKLAIRLADSVEEIHSGDLLDTNFVEDLIKNQKTIMSLRAAGIEYLSLQIFNSSKAESFRYMEMIREFSEDESPSLFRMSALKFSLKGYEEAIRSYLGNIFLVQLLKFLHDDDDHIQGLARDFVDKHIFESSDNSQQSRLPLSTLSCCKIIVNKLSISEDYKVCYEQLVDNFKYWVGFELLKSDETRTTAFAKDKKNMRRNDMQIFALMFPILIDCIKKGFSDDSEWFLEQMQKVIDFLCANSAEILKLDNQQISELATHETAWSTIQKMAMSCQLIREIFDCGKSTADELTSNLQAAISPYKDSSVNKVRQRLLRTQFALIADHIRI